MDKLKFIYTIYIAATPEKIWTALTSGELTQKYFFGRRVESDWQVGSSVTYWRDNDELDVQGKILECDPPRRLSFTWNVPNVTRERPSRATFELKSMGSFVKLTLVHDDLIPEDFVEDPNTFRGLNNGWPAILSNLKSVLETGKEFKLYSKIPAKKKKIAANQN